MRLDSRSRLVLTLALGLVIAGCGSDGLEDAPQVEDAIQTSRQAHPEAWQRRVIVLAMDSCDPDLVETLIRRGKLPNFARMRREGAHGRLRSLTPLLSPVIWTTVATGMTPERHGILDFVVDTPKGKRPVTSRHRQADTVWELVAAAGDPVGVVGWLASWPAEPINGFLVTDRVGRLAYEADRFGEAGEGTPNAAFPAELIPEIARHRVTIDDLPLQRLRAFVDVSEEEYADAYTTTYADPTNLLGNLRLIMADAETYRAVGEELYRKERPRLFLAYFNAMDALSHFFMPLAPPRMPHIPEAPYLKFRDVIEANYVWHDRVLGEYMDMADENTTVIVISDHGFKHGALRTSDSAQFLAKTGAAWHRQYGVIYAWGGGVARGQRIRGANVFDIAPTLLAALGYPVPRDMPGDVLEEAFEGGLPHETVDTWFGERRRDSMAEERAAGGSTKVERMSPEQEEEMMRLLDGLGYEGMAGAKNDPTAGIMNLAVRLLAVRRYEKAIEELQRAVRSVDERSRPRALMGLARAHVLHGESLRARGDIERADKELVNAEAALAAAVALLPADGGVGPIMMRAQIARQRGDLDSALVWAEQAVEAEPLQPAVHNELAEICKRLAERARDGERPEEALLLEERVLQALQTSLRREPTQFHALVQLALLELSSMPSRTATREEQIEHIVSHAESALRHLDAAIDLLPNSPTAHNNRAIAQMRIGSAALMSGNRADGVGRLEDALRSAQQALDIQPGYAIGWANQAYVLWKLERMDEAREAAMTAREHEPQYRFDPKFTSALDAAGKSLPILE